jgi:hypothetical protein
VSTSASISGFSYYPDGAQAVPELRVFAESARNRTLSEFTERSQDRTRESNLSAFESRGRPDGRAQGPLNLEISRKSHERCDSSRNACTASNSFSRFFSIMIVWVPSESST